MKILIVHNRYKQKGGEDSVVEDEARLLEQHGHEVTKLIRSNDELDHMSGTSAATSTVWSRKSAQQLKDIVGRESPDVVHLHNTFPLVSPAVYWAAADLGVPTVQTLHNFRLLCAQAMLLRNDAPCEDCVGTLPWRGVVRACYRESYAQSAVLVTMLAIHRLLGTYQKKVSRFIALNEFCRMKFIEGGLPAEKVVVKPNFVPDSGMTYQTPGKKVLFVGRLSKEKGIATLAKLIDCLPDVEFEIVGDGPEANTLRGKQNVNMRGSLPLSEVKEAMAGCCCLLLPSIWYENFPRTLVEAFSLGVPVFASRIGALAELIKDNETGFLFEPGNHFDLASKLKWAIANPRCLRDVGIAARREYEKRYTPTQNYTELAAIYDAVIREKELSR